MRFRVSASRAKAKLRDLRRDLGSGGNPNATYTVGNAQPVADRRFDATADSAGGRPRTTLDSVRWGEVLGGVG
jgi:hypothetical protein